MTPSFIPSLERLVASLARRPLRELWTEPHELARATLDALRRSGATHALVPFDPLALAEAAGATIAWDADVPSIAATPVIDVAELEPDEVLTKGRIPAAIQVVRYLSPGAQVAAHVPAPALLVRQLNGDPGDEETIAATEDLVAGLLRLLLESGAALVVVRGDDTDRSEPPGWLIRLVEHFGVRAVLAEGTGPDVVTLPPDALEGELHSEPALGEEAIVLTSGPVPPGVDLAALGRLAGRIRRREPSPC